MIKIFFFMLSVGLATLPLTPTLSYAGPTNLKRPNNSQIIPDRFLRSWDTVTLFMDKNYSKKNNTPEDHPQRYISMSPKHPGAYTWLNSKTLQFRPAEAWPPLTKFTFKIKGSKTKTLTTLMSAPLSSTPSQGSQNLDPLDNIHLSFPHPIHTKALARMINIELRPLPGINNNQSQWLDSRHFTLKTIERNDNDSPVHYVVQLKEKIPLSTKALVHLRLSLKDNLGESFHHINFSTKTPLHITHMGCIGQVLPIPPSGAIYEEEQALRCTGRRELLIKFSSPINPVGPIQGRNLLRITPRVENIRYSTQNNTLTVSGDFKSNQVYTLRLAPSNIVDQLGQSLALKKPSQASISFVPKRSFLNWKIGQGIVERFGPQMIPVRGSGHERVDVRIYPIDALDRSYWPFPNKPVSVDESKRPPSPGEEVKAFTNLHRHIYSHELQQQIRRLGSPSVSRIIRLPLKKNAQTANFGLDLRPLLKLIGKHDQTGTFLVGLRRLDETRFRQWMRIQITDLSLSTIEESNRVIFSVNSLKTGNRIRNAKIKLQATRSYNGKSEWIDLASGKTDQNGRFSWRAPGYQPHKHIVIRRIVVEKDGDRLVLNPNQAPDQYYDNHWGKVGQAWLQWTVQSLSGRSESTSELCHIYTERPVYKPADPVHIQAYIRSYLEGEHSISRDYATSIVVQGPGDLEWRYPISQNQYGSVYKKFMEDKLPTGNYSASLEYKRNKSNIRCATVHFRKEDFRLPRFEVALNAPTETRLDQAFNVNLFAKYYAGGKVAKQPVRWRVTQFPYTWTPVKKRGFYYSTDARFSGHQRFLSTPSLTKNGETDEEGSTILQLDPSIEPSAQPRRYIVEATVTGADDQTVSHTAQVLALPPFVLGLKLPRYLPKATSIQPQFLVAGANGKILAGQKISMRLIHRQWHSHLEASDFSSGQAKYRTETVDETVLEKSLTSEDKIGAVKLPIKQAGVYIVELESYDKLGRAQRVAVDLFVGGKENVTWSQGPKKVFRATPSKASFEPGETANIILESPYASANALAIFESPNGQHAYKWIPIRKGKAHYSFKIQATHVPRVPVHFLLMRGRSNKKLKLSQLDLHKPATLAATAWIKVAAVRNKLSLQLDYPQKAQPGDNITVKLRLQDHNKRAVSGQVTLWLVDQAVLALGKEQALDPLNDFIKNRISYIRMHDTRNLILGHIPFVEDPGGGAPMAKEASALMDKVSVRKNFKAVPFFKILEIDDSGQASIKIKLPDNLTNFKVRAKIVSGPHRFGFAKGHIAVRLPVLVQPSLPRFVRPKDQFTAISLGRVVEGDGGAGLANIKLQGLDSQSTAAKKITLDKLLATRIEYPLTVPTPNYDKSGQLQPSSANVTLAIKRSSDGAKDAYSVDLPIKPDQRIRTQTKLYTLEKGKTITVEAIKVPVRRQGFRRQLLVTPQAHLLKMVAGLSYLLEYPHGCTEQRLSKARALIASKSFSTAMGGQIPLQQRSRHAVKNTLEWIDSSLDGNKLVAYWPGGRGYVSLTAWSALFMIEARDAGFDINDELLDTLGQSLKGALRSNYGYFINGEDYGERVWSLVALSAMGEQHPGYAAELARKSQYLNLESMAQVSYTLAKQLNKDKIKQNKMLQKLNQEIWKGLIFRLHQGKKQYAGLQERYYRANALILPSETRSIAEVLRSMSAAGDTNRQQVIVNSLVTLGQGDGWGSTNANAAALLALTEFIKQEATSGQAFELAIQHGDKKENMQIKNLNSIKIKNYSDNQKLSVKMLSGPQSVKISVETRYLAEHSGSHEMASAKGFAVSREILKLVKGPMEKIPLDKAGKNLKFSVSQVIEEHVEVVNPKNRNYVAIIVPLAAGMEPLNPNLATSPPEAKAKNSLTRQPTYASYRDDHVAFYYDDLPKGNYHFYFRSRASIPGEFSQPPAYAEMMYKESVNGQSNGARIIVKAKTKPE